MTVIEKREINIGKINFFLQGMASLITWNALLGITDFFDSKFPNRNMNFVFPLPYFLSMITVSFILPFASKIITPSNRMIIGHFGMLVSFILTLIIPLVLENSNFGFWLFLFDIFILGIFNCFSQNSNFGIANMFPYNYSPITLTGGGFAGMLIGIVRAILLASIGDGKQYLTKTTIVYYIISAIVLVICIVMYFIFKNTHLAKHYMKRRSVYSFYHVEEVLPELISSDTEKYHQQDQQALINDIEFAKFKKPSVFDIFKKTYMYIFSIMLIYIVTFMNFPGMSLKVPLQNVSIAWSVTIVIFVYNIADTCSKYLANIRFYNKYFAFSLVLLRAIFFLITFERILSPKGSGFKNDILFLIMMAFFAFSNGLSTSMLFTLAPEVVEKNEKETTGLLNGLALQIGIASGLFLSLTYDNIS